MLNEDIGQPKRVYGLDILRALSILPVVIVHAHVFLQNINTNYPWIPLLGGVDSFFVLSGFLIGSILIKIYSGTPDFNMGTVFSFLKRRWFRTLPNYYLILLLNLLFVYFGITDGDIRQFGPGFLIFSQNLVHPFIGFFWESWSLTVEEWFYLLFPFTLLCLLLVLKNKISRKHLFLAGIVIFLTIPFLFRLYRSMHMNVDYFAWDNSFKKIVLLRLDGIGWGILAAYIKFYHNTIFYKYKNILFVAGIVLYAYVQYPGVPVNSIYSKVFQFTLIGITIMLTIPKFDSIKLGKGIVSKIVTHISKISYSMYLVNLGIVAQVIGAHAAPRSASAAIITYILYWAVVIGLSSVIYRYFEKPIMDLRDKRINEMRILKAFNKIRR